MDETVGKESKRASNGAEGFGLALLGTTIACVMGMAVVIGMTSAMLPSMAVPVFSLLALFAWLVVECVHAGRMRIWNRFWGLIAGALLGVALVVAWICYEVSHMHIGGF